MDGNLTSELSAKGYWPAVAMGYFNEKKYSKTVELCMLRLKQYPDVLSGRIVLARALFHAGQLEDAETEFYRILQRDPDCIMALKYLGDLKFRAGDEPMAFSYYEKVLRFDSAGGGLKCTLDQNKTEVTKILTLKKSAGEDKTATVPLRELPFRTETVADILLAQGHPRLARDVYQGLVDEKNDPKVLEKLEKTEAMIKNGERKKCIDSE